MSKEQTPITAEEYLAYLDYDISVDGFNILCKDIEQYAQAKVLEALERVELEALDIIKELADLMDDVREGRYKPDSFTTQPARIFLSKQK